ncbi:MAG: hypothetical protein Q7T18_01625, partial [Sedimentisphaerales bacterium]|nr:hypothetical protein [Sedimentisphaerales bacterium]
GGQTGSTVQILLSGQPVGQFYTFQYAGRTEAGVSQFDAKKLQKALQDYGSAATRRLMKSWLNELDATQAEADK